MDTNLKKTDGNGREFFTEANEGNKGGRREWARIINHEWDEEQEFSTTDKHGWTRIKTRRERETTNRHESTRIGKVGWKVGE